MSSSVLTKKQVGPLPLAPGPSASSLGELGREGDLPGKNTEMKVVSCVIIHGGVLRTTRHHLWELFHSKLLLALQMAHERSGV